MMLIPGIRVVCRGICLKNFLVINNEVLLMKVYTGMEQAESLIV